MNLTLSIENLTIIFDSGLTSEEKNESFKKSVMEAPVSAPETIPEQVDTTPALTVKQAVHQSRLLARMRKLGCSEEFLASVTLP